MERGSEVAGPGPQVCQAGGGGQVEQVVQEGDHLGRQVEVSCRLVVLEGDRVVPPGDLWRLYTQWSLQQAVSSG